jgi:hypothetical protein
VTYQGEDGYRYEARGRNLTGSGEDIAKEILKYAVERTKVS